MWLLAGLPTCILLVMMWHRYDVRQEAALAKFVAPHLRRQLAGSISAASRIMQRGLYLAAAVCLFVALAGPLAGYHWEQIKRRGNEVVFAIDTSRSMLTPDVKPNRLTRAKLAIDDMARQLDGDAIGIVAFAGSAFLVCPLTLDYGAFHESLDAIDIHTIPRGGTNISSAILAARSALRRHPGSDRIMILVTDGEDLEGSAAAAATEASKQVGLKIYTVGIGTAEGDLIPLSRDQGGGFVKDESGAFVKSHLDENALKAIASATGGAYVRLGSQGEDFEVFLRTVFGAVTKHDLIYRQQKIYTQRYQWPLAASLLLLLSSLLVGTRRWNWGRRASRAAALSTVIWMLVMHTESSAHAADAKTPLVEYNAGTSAYRAGQFPQATQAFNESIRSAPASDVKRLADQEDAYYNLGNALYRAGEQIEKSAPQNAIEKWTDAVKAYDTALQLRANDADSKYNRDFVQRRIDALKRPQNQGQGQGQGQGGGSGQGQGQGSGSGQGQGRGNGQGQGQPPDKSQGQPPGEPPPQGRAGAAPQNANKDSQQASPHAGPPPNAAAPKTDPSAPHAGQGTPPPAPAAFGQPEGGSAEPRAPGQMSLEEARELLDSAKSDEHHTLGVPSGPRDPDNPDKPFKDW